MISAWVANPNFDMGPNALIYVYEKIKQGKEINLQEHGIESTNHDGKANVSRDNKSIISLENATRMSIELLEQSSDEDL